MCKNKLEKDVEYPLEYERKIYRRLFWIVLILINVAVIGYVILCGYMKKDYSVNQKINSNLIGLSYMTMNNEFYKIINEEISARVEMEGDRMVLRDPALDVDRQIEQINEMLDMGINVLVVTPVDWEKLTSVLEIAKSQGVLIIVLDTNVSNEELVDCTIISNNYEAGVIVGEYFLQQYDNAKVLVMTHETTKSGQDRVNGFIDTVSKQPGIEIVQKVECEGQVEIAMPRIQEVIDAGIKFNQVFCLNDLASVGVVAALEENHLLDYIDVYGVDASPDSKVLIKEGMMKASAAQFPSEIGKRASEVIYQLLRGEKVESHILVPVELVTQENVETFGIDRWQ